MSPERKVLPASRIASAAGAMAITSILLLAVGFGFSSQASARLASELPPVSGAPEGGGHGQARGA